MKLWISDYKPSGERRSWSHMLDNVPFDDFTYSEKAADWNTLNGPGVVILHHSIPEAECQTEWAGAENVIAGKRIWVIAISGSGHTQELTGNYFYYRKQRVLAGAGTIDSEFQSCFAKFWEDLQQQEHAGREVSPDFRLLEPSGIPESLLAWVLAKLVGDEAIAGGIPVEAVRKDFAQLKRTVGDKAQNLVWDDSDAASSFTNAKELIQRARVDV